MKLSLRWLFDHIQTPWHQKDLASLVDLFNRKTAEIEEVRYTELAVEQIFLAEVLAHDQVMVRVTIAELGQERELPYRQEVRIGQFYLLKKELATNSYYWATMRDLGSEKDVLMSEISCAPQELAGSWKKSIELSDYIITIDNKSITHRPDMWGHRGCAREIAALLGLPLIAEEEFLATLPIKQYATESLATQDMPFSLSLQDTRSCDRFAGLYIPHIAQQATPLALALRLARIDSKPINFLVDVTNYVMFDTGQPLHAFDAATLRDARLEVRLAQPAETLTLLDGTQIILQAQDLVVSDEKKVVSLAGVMGGNQTGITAQTTQLLIEAAHFNPTAIRLQAARHKKRTEASARFEKNIDPNQNTQALLRFIKLLEQYQNDFTFSGPIISLGSLAPEKSIYLAQSFITERLGIMISPEFVEKSLQSLGFGFTCQQTDTDILYRISIPSWRATKDILIPEDMVEELGRLFGYEKIPLQLPLRTMQTASRQLLLRKRLLKQHLAFALAMKEVLSYAFYDEEFIQKIPAFTPPALELKNPVSAYSKRLVTSLIPHLLKTVLLNAHPRHNELRFFECNKIWQHTVCKESIIELLSVAGIFYTRTTAKQSLPLFYQYKALLVSLFTLLEVPVRWVQNSHAAESLYEQGQSAELWLKEEKIGIFGALNPAVATALEITGSVFMFELSADALCQYQPAQKLFSPLAKYPEISIDLSVLIDKKVTVELLEQALLRAHPYLLEVNLIDFFEKPAWKTERSVTFRCRAAHAEKTLTKEEIEIITQALEQAACQLGGSIR